MTSSPAAADEAEAGRRRNVAREAAHAAARADKREVSAQGHETMVLRRIDPRQALSRSGPQALLGVRTFRYSVPVAGVVQW
jgi:hypothetical protein